MAWRDAAGVYWVSNTLLASLTNRQMLDDREVAARRAAAHRHLASLTRLMSEPRTDRRHRHRLRRARHGGGVRRARARGVVRRHRRRQDRRARARRGPDLRARARGAGGARTASGCTSRPSCADALEHARLLFVAVGTPPTYSGDADLSAVHAVVDAMPAVRPPRARDEVDGAGRHRRRRSSASSPSRARRASATCRARSS